MIQKIYHINTFFCHHQIFNLFQYTLKVALQYLFKVVILFNTVFYLKLNFKLKVDRKTCTFKNLEKICQKTVATLFSLSDAQKATIIFNK